MNTWDNWFWGNNSQHSGSHDNGQTPQQLLTFSPTKKDTPKAKGFPKEKGKRRGSKTGRGVVSGGESKPNKNIARGAIDFDLDLIDNKLGSVLAEDDKRKLRVKAERLYRAYENNYQCFLSATQFWDQLQKIKFDSVNSYHDIFTERVVGCSTPIWNADRLAKYSDVINTAFYLAVKERLCDSMGTVNKDCNNGNNGNNGKKSENPNVSLTALTPLNQTVTMDTSKSLLEEYFD